MNFDELKNKFGSDRSGFDIPEKVIDFKKSNLPIEKVRASMKSEILTQLGFIIIFFSVLLVVDLYPIAHSVYIMLMSLASMITLMYLIKMIRFVRKTTYVDANSRSSLEFFVTELKLTLEVYKTAVLGSSLLLPLPVAALFFGNMKTNDPDLFSTYFLLDGPTINTLLIIAIFIAVGIVFYFITIWWADKLYGKHVKMLESVLFDLV